MKKIVILILLSLALYILWIIGLEKWYAYLLYWGSSFVLSPFSNITPVLKADLIHPDFCVAVGQEGYCMQLELFGLSVLLLLAWFGMRIFTIRTKRIFLRTLLIIFIFYILQVLVMSSLALYDLSFVIQQINNALRQGFAIIAVFIIIFDSLTTK